MSELARYLSPEEAAALFREMAAASGVHEVAAITNLEYVFAPRDLYLLAPKVTEPLDRIAAFLVDMDGTSTTTEPLALHSLEYMVRRFTGRLAREEWSGLDPVKDYPFVIGNSNFRHTEFLVDRYKEWLRPESLRQAFFESLLWTLSSMDDPHRRRDIRLDAVNCGLSRMLEDPEFLSAVETPLDETASSERAERFLAKYGEDFQCENRAALVSAALDIYYFRYHAIMRRVERGEGGTLSKELLGEAGRHLVEPMAGYAVFLALIKGWLGEEAGALAPVLLAGLSPDSPTAAVGEDEARARLIALGKRFAKRPARVALVTASIAYETHATIRAIFDVMQEQFEAWPVSAEKREELKERFADYTAVYDGFVNATDSSEARLKPHRDLYAIALYQMSIPRSDYGRCIGLEDTEPGILSLRAAGVGCAVALPNHDTSRQDYRAASHVVHGGLPELILGRNLLLAEV